MRTIESFRQEILYDNNRCREIIKDNPAPINSLHLEEFDMQLENIEEMAAILAAKELYKLFNGIKGFSDRWDVYSEKTTYENLNSTGLFTNLLLTEKDFNEIYTLINSVGVSRFEYSTELNNLIQKLYNGMGFTDVLPTFQDITSLKNEAALARQNGDERSALDLEEQMDISRNKLGMYKNTASDYPYVSTERIIAEYQEKKASLSTGSR